MWTRDAGVFLRELTLWGYLEEACQTASCLMRLVRPNPQGFLTFPMYFKLGEPASGSELDGTAAILIALVLLWERLPAGHSCRDAIRAFLEQPSSPLRYLLIRLETHPLVPGSGEFGGGVGLEGEFYNVVQNNLARLALQAAARAAAAWGASGFAEDCKQAAERLEANMLAHLADPQDGWIWTVDLETMRPDPAVLNAVFNQGFGGLNGVLAMCADVGGLTPLQESAEICRVGLRTLDSLYNRPQRRQMFERHGAWTQFDRLWDGFLTSPSYGQGYAIQALLLADRMPMAERAIEFLARVTREPYAGNRITRESPYLFYERIYLPELLTAWTSPHNLRAEQPDWIANGFDGQVFDEGCGALNLVNVAEPLKVARLILGVDDADPQRLRLIPRLPPGWQGVQAQNWPVLTPAGWIRIRVGFERSAESERLEIELPPGAEIPRLAARLADGQGWRWQEVLHPQGRLLFEGGVRLE